MENAKRNARIRKLLAEQRLSYSLIAEEVGATRNAVAGVAFRNRHPSKTRTGSPAKTSSRNKMGTGWQPRSYDPEEHLPFGPRSAA